MSPWLRSTRASILPPLLRNEQRASSRTDFGRYAPPTVAGRADRRGVARLALAGARRSSCAADLLYIRDRLAGNRTLRSRLPIPEFARLPADAAALKPWSGSREWPLLRLPDA